MKSIREVCAEHRQIETLVAKMRATVAAPVADAAAVAGLRWTLAQALLDHCQQEDRAVYDPLLASGDAAATAVAWRYRHEFGALNSALVLHISDWPVDRINSNWTSFRADTETVMAKIAARVQAEEHELYPHAERVAAQRRAA